MTTLYVLRFIDFTIHIVIL